MKELEYDQLEMVSGGYTGSEVMPDLNNPVSQFFNWLIGGSDTYDRAAELNQQIMNSPEFQEKMADYSVAAGINLCSGGTGSIVGWVGMGVYSVWDFIIKSMLMGCP
jgi:hypothetical protein